MIRTWSMSRGYADFWSRQRAILNMRRRCENSWKKRQGGKLNCCVNTASYPTRLHSELALLQEPQISCGKFVLFHHFSSLNSFIGGSLFTVTVNTVIEDLQQFELLRDDSIYSIMTFE